MKIAYVEYATQNAQELRFGKVFPKTRAGAPSMAFYAILDSKGNLLFKFDDADKFVKAAKACGINSIKKRNSVEAIL